MPPGEPFEPFEKRAARKNIVSEVEEKFEISSVVQKTLERIVRKIEALDCKRRAVHRRGRNKDKKFAGRQSKPYVFFLYIN